MDTPSPSSDPLHGLNPHSLMAAAAMPTDSGTETLPLSSRDTPSLEEMIAAFPSLEIQELIGQGGMGAVFRARQPRLDRLVALKVLPKSLAATPGFAERFMREGRVLARLNHPHIVSVHDFGESHGFYYLMMEYVEGVNLRQAMRAGRFTPEQALAIIPALCDALQFAHSQGVLHRDIKPENLLLDSHGRVKVVDFGIAKLVGNDSTDATLLTQSGVKLGTVPYMAPEQIEKPATVDHRADIYSLGVVLYELLTGELPLGRFAAPSEKAPVSNGLDEVVFRSLEKERERRQQSATEFKTQLQNLPATTAPASHSRSQPWGVPLLHFEYISPHTLWGLPLLHVVVGRDSATGRRRKARGIIAFGDIATGVIALGGYAKGVFACGGMAVGVMAWGGVSVGLVSLGGLALALLLAIGGISIGPVAGGGVALGWQALGGLVFAWHGFGAKGYVHSGFGGDLHATHVVSSMAEMPQALQLLASSLPWWASVGSFLWLPVVALMSWLPWWARRQYQAQVAASLQAAPRAPKVSLRILWLIPAAMIVCAGVFSPDITPTPPPEVKATQSEPPANSGKKVAQGIPIPPLKDIARGTIRAPEQKPLLRFLRLQRNATEWQGPLYTSDGKPIPEPEAKPFAAASKDGGVQTQNADDCWLQFGFEHPDFDRHSRLSVEITTIDGQPLPNRSTSTGSSVTDSSDPQNPNIRVFTISPGRVGNLPKAIRLTFSYSIGLWEKGPTLSPDFQGSMAFGTGCYLAGFGNDSHQRAFVSWTRPADQKTAYDATVKLRRSHSSEPTVGSLSYSSTGPLTQPIEKVSFSVSLHEVASFHIRKRPIQSVTWDNVVLPPLP